MKKLVIGIVASVLLCLAAPGQNINNPCIEGSGSACQVAPVVNFLTVTNNPIVVCTGAVVSLCATYTNIPGLVVTTTTNLDCSISVTSNSVSASIVTNWWVALVGSYSNSGSGLCANFTPTSGGTGTLKFRLVYTKSVPCGSGQPQTLTNVVDLVVNLESGPQTNAWTCIQQGTVNTSGTLAFTNLNVCAGDSISGPGASGISFNDGKKRAWVSYSCAQNQGQNHWITNNVTYAAGSLYFEPAIPSSYTTPGTYQHVAKVNGIASGGVCSDVVGVVVGTVTINVRASRPSGLVGWWRAEGNGYDLVGERSGMLWQDATFVSGKVGQAFSFDGTGDAVRLGNHASLQLQNFTIEAWVKRGDVQKVSNDLYGGSIFGYGWGGYLLGLNDNGTVFLTQVGINNVTTTVAITNLNWHHLAVTKNNTNVIFYINGVAYPIASAYTATFDFDTDVAIGCRGDLLQNTFLGAIDEVSLYDRALSGAEIGALFGAGANGKCLSPLPECHAFTNGGFESALTNWTYTLAPGQGGVEVLGPPSLDVEGDRSVALGAGEITNSFLAQTFCLAPGVHNVAFKHASLAGVSTIKAAVVANGSVLVSGIFSNTVPSEAGAIPQGNQRVGNLTFTVPSGVSNVTLSVLDLTVDTAADPVIDQVTLDGIVVTRPEDQTVNIGGNASFVVRAGGRATLAYQWKKGSTQISGATTSALSLTGVALGDAGSYSVDVSGPDGSVNSGVGILTVNSALAITENPASQTVVQGNNATFTVAAAGGLPLSYQWRFNDNNISGATDTQFVRTAAQVSDAGNYTAVVSNPSGSVTSTVAVLTVVVPPSITTQPVSQTVVQGANVTFSVTAAGTTPLAYQWRFNSVDISGATDSALALNNVQLSHAGAYAVRVTNSGGNALSAAATLTVVQVSRVIVDGSNPENEGPVSLCSGTALTLRAIPGPGGVSFPSGQPVWTITSQPSGSSLSNPTAGDVTATLTPVVAGQYTVQAACGTSSNSFVINALDSGDADYDGVGGCQELVVGENVQLQLSAWYFDSLDFEGWQGNAPLLQTNVNSVGGWSILGVEINSNNGPALLVYREIETNNSIANINLRNGSIRLWYRSDWNSTGTNNGTGPQREARLVDVGQKGSSDGWWGLVINPSGTSVYLATQTNNPATLQTNVSAAIQWTSNDWHQVVLTYSPTNSVLYIDGVLAASGTGVSNWPGAAVRSEGFRVGSDKHGTNWAQGRFDNLQTFNHPLTQHSVTNHHKKHPRPLATNNCLLAPIALYVTNVLNLSIGSIAYSTSGIGPGNFGWLDWNGGSSSAGELGEALTNWTKCFTFVNANDPNDRTLSVDDWIYGNSGVSASVAPSMNWLTNTGTNFGIVLWNEVTAENNGSNAKYRAARYVQIRLLDYSLSTSQKWFKYQYLGPIPCDSISNRPPTIAIFNPTNFQIFNAPATIPIFAAANDPEDAMSNVTFYAGTTLLGRVPYSIGTTNVTNDIYTLTWPNVTTSGTYQLTAVATDALNVSRTSAVVNVIVNGAPQVTAGPNQTNIWPVGENTTSVTLPGFASDDGLPFGTLTASWSVISSNGPVTFGNPSSTNTTATFTTNGVYVLRLTVSDGAASASSQCTIVVKRAPFVSITWPTNNSIFPAGVTLTNAAWAYDLDGTVTNVQFFLSGTNLLGTAIPGADDIYTFRWPSIPSGSYVLTAVATDNEGLITTSAPPVNILVSSMLAVQITQPSDGAVFVAPATIPIHALVASSSDISRVEFFANGNLIGTDAVSANPYVFVWAGVPANGSNYNLTARAVDIFGNSATSAVVSIRVVTPIQVNAGPDRIVLITNASIALALDGTITGGAGNASSLWSQIVGPATAVFSSTSVTDPDVTLTNKTGNYLLRLSATDGYSSAADTMMISVLTNRPPVVDAGPNRIIPPGSFAILNGSVTDDGLPQPPSLSNWWTVVNGPAGGITFTNINSPLTVASNFTVVGVYTLRLNSTDGLATGSDEMTVTVAPSVSRTYTLNADFAEGALVNINFDEMPHQLQLNYNITPFPYVWIACSDRDTIVRIDANTGQVLGEFRTSPQTRDGNPSRTTVDKYGNAWVANRNDMIDIPGVGYRGSITRVALVIGGTRGDKTTNGTNVVFVPNPQGHYLQPPFWYCTAVDRDGDGLIKTSAGLADVLDWDPSFTSSDDYGGVTLADDECIINYTRVAGTGTRTIAIDARNDLWVGGHGNWHEKVSGVTGMPIANTAFNPGGGGYGGLIDGSGVLWSSASLFRFDIARRFDMTANPPVVIDPSYKGVPVVGNYGIGIDPNTGYIWCSSGGSVIKVSPDGLETTTYNNPEPVSSQGIAVDDRENVWVAGSLGGNTVAHFRTDGTFVGNIDLGCSPTGGNHGPTGVAIDSNGKVWAANITGTAMRIDPSRGLRMVNGVPNPFGHPLGEVDMTVQLNAPGQQSAGAYNYSDMTGFISLGATEPSGIWRVVHDSGVTNQAWGVVQWSSLEPAGTSIKVEVRAANEVLQLTATNNPFQPVTNGVVFSGMAGRYVEIRATFAHRPGTNSTPVLYDLTVSSGLPIVIANPVNLAQDDGAAVFENSVNNVINVLRNDEVPPGATLLITGVSSPRSGYVKNQSTNLVYTPNTNFFGIDQFIYTTSDGQGGISRGVVSVSVGRVIPLPQTNLYSAPIARDDTNIFINGFTWDQLIRVMDNDEDTNNPVLPFSIISLTQPTHGTVRIGGCGVYYTPNSHYFGPDSFTYTIRNSRGISDSARVDLMVVGQPVDIACGVTVTNRLATTNTIVPLQNTSAYAHAYTFWGNPTQAVTIGFDEYTPAELTLYDEHGEEVATGSYYNPIVYVPRTTNGHWLEVSSYLSPTYSVDYILSFDCSTAQVPHIAVMLGNQIIPSGGGIDFGVTHVGRPVLADLTITNYGAVTLNVWWAGFDPNDGLFTLSETTLPSSITVPPGGSSNLTVRFEALDAGVFSNRWFKINSDDEGQIYYDLQLQARANPTNTIPPTVVITNPLPNAVFAGFDVWSSPGISITVTSAPATGASIWGINYYARTSTGSNIPIGQRLTPDWDDPNKFTLDWYGVPPGGYELTAIAIDDSGLQTVSSAVPVTVLRRPVNAPEMQVLFFGTNNLPNDSTIDFGVVPPHVPVEVTLTITNLGATPLTNTLSTSSSEYYFTNSPVGEFTIEPQGSTNVTLVFKTGTYGTFSDRFAYFDSNDPGLYGPFNAEQGLGRLRLELTAIATNTGAAPTIGIVSPAANAQFNAPATVVVKASVTNHSGGTIARVDFYSGTVYIGTAYGPQASGLYEFTWLNVPVGNYSLKAVVVDYNGFASSSTTVPISVIVRPANSPILQVFLAQTELFNGATIDYGIRALNSTVNGVLTLSNSGTVSLTITNLSLNGDFSLINSPTTPFTIPAAQSTNITVRYNASWQGQSDGLLTITNGDPALNPFYITNVGRANPANATPPTVTITNPVASASFVASVTYSTAPIRIDATASASGGASVSYVEFFAIDPLGTTTLIGYGYPDGNGVFSMDWWYVDAGAYKLKAIAHDTTGAQGVSTLVPITVLPRSATSPHLKVLFFGTNELANGSTINFGIVPTNTPVEVDLLITNLGPGIFTNTYTYLWSSFSISDGPESAFTLAPQTSTNITVVFNSPDKGQYSGGINFSSNDDGLYGQYSVGTYQLMLSAIATNLGPLPTIVITNPASASTVLIPANVPIEVAVTASATEPLSYVQYFARSATTNILLCGGCGTSFTWQNPPPGQYELIAVAVDSIGRAVASAPVPLTVRDRPETSPIMRMFLAATNDLPNRSTIDFGITEVGNPIVAPLTISNAGNAALNISKFICPSNIFTITNELTLPLTLAAGASTNFNLLYLATVAGETNGVLTIYNNDVASHPFHITNRARANRNNGEAPIVQLTAPTNGSRYIFPADVMISATASCATNTALVAINFYTTGPGGTVQIGQLLAEPDQTNMSGTFTWTRPVPGVYTIKAIAVDQSGLMGESANVIQIEVKDGNVDPNNVPPDAKDDLLIMQGVLSGSTPPTYTINVLANDTDANLDQLQVTSFSYSGQLGRMTQEGNRLLFTPNPAWAGTNYAYYTISDNKGGTDGAWIELVIVWPNLPTVSLITPENGAYIELPMEPSQRVLTLSASAVSGNTGGHIQSVKFYDQEELLGTVTSGVNNVYSFAWQLPPSGDHLISAVALDEVGQENITQPAYIYIAGKPNNTLPTATITNLAATLDDFGMDVYPNVTNGIIDVLGLARDADTEDAVSYQILLYRPDGTFVQNVTPNKGANGFRVGTDANGVLATNVDLSLYENGIYDIVLNVFDGWEFSSDTARILLNTYLKIGQFSFTVQDITLPVGGMPLSVSRTYNSMNLRSGDFGYSWTYALSDLNVELDETREEAIDFLSGDRFSLRVGGGRNVTLTLPDGRRVTYQFYFDGPNSCGFGWDPYCYDAAWEAPPGVTAKLTALGSPFYNGLTDYWNNAAGTGFENFDFRGFVLETEDGTKYIIEREDEGEHFIFSGYNDDYYVQTYGKPRLTTIIQPSRDTFTISSSTIQHYDPTGQPTRAFDFERDEQGRIIAIHDPNSAIDGLPVLKYVYDDPVGNLAQVQTLVNRSTGLYESTFYQYTNTQFPHFLTGIIDPRGVQLAKTFYDDNGRIWKVIDADGRITEFKHDLDNRTEVIVDRSGNTNSYVYDLKGNVIWMTNALQEVTRSMYEDPVNPALKTAETNAFGTAGATWMLYAYDERGNLTNIVHSPDRTNSYVYDGQGRVLQQVDALGNVTTNSYDAGGNVTNTVVLDRDGNLVQQSWYIYENGRLTQTRNGSNQITSHLFYDASGNVTNTIDANGRSRTFAFDENGNQTNTSYVWIDPAGTPHTISARTEYDSAGRPVRNIDGEGNTNETVYAMGGQIAYTVDKLGNTNSFLYDARGNLIQTTHYDGVQTRSVFDVEGREILSTDRNGLTGTRTDFDALGRATNSVRLSGPRIDIVADPVNPGQLKSVIGAPGNVLSTSITEYDSSGRIKSRTGTDGQKTQYEYWPDGQVKFVTDPLTNITYFEYNAAGQQTAIKDALNRTNRFEYDAVGRLIKTVYADNTFTTNQFDILGRKVGERDQAGILTQFAYNTAGSLTNVIKAPVFDPELGLMKSPEWSYIHDQMGNLAVTVDPKGRATTNRHDAFNRPLARLLPGGQMETNIYNGKGQLWKQFDFKGQKTEFVYDKFGRLRAKFRFDASSLYPSNAVCYQYNQVGQLQKVVERYGEDANSNACDGYAALVPSGAESVGSLSRIFNAGRVVIPIAFAIGLLGLVIGLVPGLRLTLRYLADFYLRGKWRLDEFAPGTEPRRLRLPSIFWRFATIVTLASVIGTDPTVQRLWTGEAACVVPANSSTENTRITEFTWDLDNRLSQINSPEGVINYTYDLATGRLTRTCTKNSEIEYGYDELGRLKTVSVHKRNGVVLTNPEVTTYAYTKVGSRASVTLPTGVVTTYGYDSLNRLTNLVQQVGVTNLATYSYRVHITGHRTNATEILRQEDGTYLTNVVTWNYDAMYRLTNEVSISSSPAGTYTNAYTHDLVGNRLKQIKTIGGTSTIITNVYNANDQLLRNVTQVGSVLTQTNIYNYDLNGSLVARTNVASSGTTATHYNYNLANKISSVAVNGTVQARYLYNDQGLRVRTVSSGNTNNYLIDVNNHTGYHQILEELNALGSTPTMSYVIGDDVLAQASSANTSYLLYDGHGNTRQLANASGQVTSRYNYDAYGVTLGSSSSTAAAAPTSLLYSGEQYDSTLEMYNLRARYYDPANGRLNSLDAFEGYNDDPRTLHKYLYCGADPVNCIDPSGNSLVQQLCVIAIQVIAFAIRIYPAVKIICGIWDAITICRIAYKVFTGQPVTAWDWVQFGLATAGLLLGPGSKLLAKTVMSMKFGLAINKGLRSFDTCRLAVGQWCKLNPWLKPIVTPKGTVWGGFQYIDNWGPTISYAHKPTELGTCTTLVHEFMHYCHWVLAGRPIGAAYKKWFDAAKAFEESTYATFKCADGSQGFFAKLAEIIIDIAK